MKSIQKILKLDILLALQKGGETTINNIRPICSRCNRSIGKQNMINFIKSYQTRVLLEKESVEMDKIIKTVKTESGIEDSNDELDPEYKGYEEYFKNLVVREKERIDDWIKSGTEMGKYEDLEEYQIRIRTCPSCKKLFSNSRYCQIHNYKEHYGGPYLCRFCNEPCLNLRNAQGQYLDKLTCHERGCRKRPRKKKTVLDVDDNGNNQNNNN